MESKSFDKFIKTPPTNFFSSRDFFQFSIERIKMIGAIEKKLIHVTRKIFMKKSFIDFRENI